MLELQGKYNSAKVFTDNAGQEVISQIIELLNQPFIASSVVRIMPDCHKGSGCTIGTTMTVKDKIVPNLVGVDIGCGMLTVRLADEHVDLEKLDAVIHKHVPAGFSARSNPHPYSGQAGLDSLRCKDSVNLDRAEKSIGTLGGGNHFIELGKGSSDEYYLVVHTGSRNLGKQIAEYYQNAAIKSLESQRKDTSELIAKLKLEGRESEIQDVLQSRQTVKVQKDLAYVEGGLYDDYLHDMSIAQAYADLNRDAIVDEIVKRMGLTVVNSFSTVHNYIDMDTMILRKGAVSAEAGELLLIPINMRDGSLLCVGNGNDDWNWSAPHGAGRLMSRSAAKRAISMEQYEAAMDGIYSSTVNKSTLDEAPFAYKPMDEIVANISDTAEVIDVIKPVYNFKAAE